MRRKKTEERMILTDKYPVNTTPRVLYDVLMVVGTAALTVVVGFRLMKTFAGIVRKKVCHGTLSGRTSR